MAIPDWKKVGCVGDVVPDERLVGLHAAKSDEVGLLCFEFYVDT